MKKILHLSHTDIKSDSRILKEIESLVSVKQDYIVSSIGITLDEGSYATNIKNHDYRGLKLVSKKIRFLPKIIKHMLALMEFTIRVLFATRGKKYDLIHCHDTVVLPVGVLLSFFKKSKVIYDAHELESNRNGISRLGGIGTLFVEKALWRFIDALIVVSPSIEAWYMSKVGEKTSEVILNSPVYQVQDRKSNYLREYFNIQDSAPIFIYVGILGDGRGIEKLIKVFQNTNLKSHLVFLGYGSYYHKLDDISNRSNNIHIHPAVEHTKVVPVISSADYGLCLIENISLSDYYCLPNKLFEYSFAGLKVLASNFPDLARIVTQYELGVCCEPEADSIARAVSKIEKRSYTFKEQGKDLQELSWDAQSVKLLNLYEKLLS